MEGPGGRVRVDLADVDAAVGQGHVGDGQHVHVASWQGEKLFQGSFSERTVHKVRVFPLLNQRWLLNWSSAPPPPDQTEATEKLITISSMLSHNNLSL